MFLLQFDPNTALYGELKYSYSRSFKRYWFSFNQNLNYLSYQKDKVSHLFIARLI